MKIHQGIFRLWVFTSLLYMPLSASLYYYYKERQAYEDFSLFADIPWSWEVHLTAILIAVVPVIIIPFFYIGIPWVIDGFKRK